MKTIERFRKGEIRSEVMLMEGGVPLMHDFSEQPTVLSNEAFAPNSKAMNATANWKPEQLEKIHSEIAITDQKTGNVSKSSVAEFRRHVETLESEEDVWIARDITIMHQASCLNSRKVKNCMGCSTYWKHVQTIQEDLRPWGAPDLLRCEPDHTETFAGHVTMHGSFAAQQTAMLGCDRLNTLLYADDPNAVAIWGFVSPSEWHKLAEEDCLGVNIHEGKTFVDPAAIEKKVKVTYAVQRVGQTVIVPSMYTYWTVYMGQGLGFCTSWNILRVRHLVDARKSVEMNRSLGLYKPINISSLVISAAYEKADEMECAETIQDRQQISSFLTKLLPVLKVQALEELLGEHINLSGLTIISYDAIVDKLTKAGQHTLSKAIINELLQIRSLPLPPLESDLWDDEDDELKFVCSRCKYVLFNTRRSTPVMKGYSLCEPCYNLIGKSSSNKMKRYRKISVQSIVELVENIRSLLDSHDGPSHALHHPLAVPQQPTRAKKREREREKEKEKPVPVPEIVPPLEDVESDHFSDEEVIDCICGNNKDMGFMISCEKCLAWLHGKCVGISKKNEPAVYYCPKCSPPAGGKLPPKDFNS